MQLNQKKNNSSRGFTLIEMMVAVSIFVIVAFIVTSTLLTMSSAYKKAQKMRVLMDNLSFSIQEMSLTFREGKNYSCQNSGCELIPASSWIGGGSGKVCFKKFDRGDGTSGILRCEGDCASCGSSLDGSYDMISPEINIQNLSFNVLPLIGGGTRRVVINIRGLAGQGTKYETDFNIQTTAAQRSP